MENDKGRRIRLGYPITQKMDTRYVKLRNLLLDYMSVKAKACVMACLLDLAAHIHVDIVRRLDSTSTFVSNMKDTGTK